MRPDLRFLRPLAVAFSLLALASPALAAKKSVPKPTKRKVAPKPDPARVQNPEALTAFFEALDRLQQPDARDSVRVLQFGDSHTAADLWSGRLRRRLQTRFGDGGPGLILSGRPWRGYPHEGVKVLSGVKWEAQSLRQKETTGRVGLTGAAIAAPGDESFRLRATFGALRLHVLGPGTEGALLRLRAPQGDAPSVEPTPFPEDNATEAAPTAQALPMPAPVEAATPLAVELEQPLGEDILRVLRPAQPLTPDLRELELNLPMGTRLLGVDLASGKPGVVLDELGLNGAELSDLARWNPELRLALLRAVRPQLLILAYGTNESGRGDLQPAAFQAQVEAQLRALREAARTPILLVGPLDRSARAKKKRKALVAQTGVVDKAMREAALASGCAFWDARQAMGGSGSILAWRKKKQAQKDLVHLNGAGYQRLGDLLADELLKAYDARKP